LGLCVHALLIACEHRCLPQLGKNSCVKRTVVWAQGQFLCSALEILCSKFLPFISESFPRNPFRKNGCAALYVLYSDDRAKVTRTQVEMLRYLCYNFAELPVQSLSLLLWLPWLPPLLSLSLL